jgi:hypothetical protein
MSNDDVTEKAVKKLLGVKRFTVYASETVYYSIEVEGKDEAEVMQRARDNEFEFPHDSVYDGSNFIVEEVEEIVDES